MTKRMAKQATKAAHVAESPIPESLRALAWPVAKLVPDPQNTRDHGERNLEAVKMSLLRFGWRNVIVARSDGVVVAGNARLQAAIALGWTEVPVLFVTDTAQKAAAFAIADNRTAELAEWNLEELAKQVQALGDAPELLDAIGFTDAEMENLLAADWGPADEDGALEDHKRDPVKPKGDDSKVTVVLTGAQLQVALAALDKLRTEKPRVTFGAMVEQLCSAYLGVPVAVPPKKAKAAK